MKNPYAGNWRIQEMELWDRDFIDLIVPGFITIQHDGLGYFQFGAVEGDIDYQIKKWPEGERLEFSWDGNDECDPACGRGWAIIEGQDLHGRIYFHRGDDSTFKATKVQ